MELYSLKMRASNTENQISKHISGAENIVKKDYIEKHITNLIRRAMNHSKGEADFINIKIEKINEDEIKYIEPLKVTTKKVNNCKAGIKEVLDILERIGVKDGHRILSEFKDTYNMRGAMLLDCNTFKRLEIDKERGIRVTYMDYEFNQDDGLKVEENNVHFREALVLASKVVNHPNILAEICISDDPDYVVGYVASKKYGYIRITKMKENGSENGGRIFLYNGPENEVEECIKYLENQKVLVKRGNIINEQI